jgi:hypothetical protein
MPSGFASGLRFHGNFAFVGLSKPRYERFEGLALDKKLSEADSEPWCGVQVIDLNTGTCVHDCSGLVFLAYKKLLTRNFRRDRLLRMMV